MRLFFPKSHKTSLIIPLVLGQIQVTTKSMIELRINFIRIYVSGAHKERRLDINETTCFADHSSKHVPLLIFPSTGPEHKTRD